MFTKLFRVCPYTIPSTSFFYLRLEQEKPERRDYFVFRHLKPQGRPRELVQTPKALKYKHENKAAGLNIILCLELSKSHSESFYGQIPWRTTAQKHLSG